jgi:hypothetical protein
MVGIVIDGSDSDARVCAWGIFPSFYHFKDSIIRYTTQGVGQWCHDIHDNIFEFFDNPDVPTHGNILECNADSETAFGRPANTPNVYYNNITRHATTGFSTAGQVTTWFCPNTIPEYWFSNIQYDTGNSNFWDIAGPPLYSCSNTGGQFFFNNTFVDGRAPCDSSVNNTGGRYLTVLNNHLINSPYDTSGGAGCIGGPSSATNIVMTDATAVTQGYAGSTGRINTQNSSTTCANDSTTPCIPTSVTNCTVGAGTNQQAYCATLASYGSEYAIGTEAANACKHGTTDGCVYNISTHAMVCPAQTPVTRPSSGAWNAGAYQF